MMQSHSVSIGKLKVLVLSTNSDLAGAPIHVQTIVEGLGEQVEFYVIFGEEGPVRERLASLGFKTFVVPEMRSSISPFRDLKALNRLADEMRKFKPDLIHAHSTKAGMLGRLLCLRFGVPSIYTVHGWGWRGLSKRNSKLVLFIEKILSRVGNASYIYVSRSVQNEAFVKLGLAANRGSVIYNGVRDVIGKSDLVATLTLMMPARVSSAKDHECLVKAFDRLEGDVSLVLCGGGTNDPNFISKLKVWSPNRFNRIICMGERSDIPSLLNSSDIFLLISNFEALPLSIIEAMSASKAIIATDVGGVSELIQDGFSGILVQKNNVDDVFSAINTMLDAEQRKSYGANARADYLKKFTDRMMLDSIYDFYLRAYASCHDTR